MANNRGTILPITLGFALVFTMLGTASLYMSTLQSEAQEKQVLSQKAFWLAEAGLIQYLHNWSLDPKVPPPTNQQPFADGGIYDAAVLIEGIIPRVTVTGNYNGIKRTVSAQFIKIPKAFENTISTGGNLTSHGAGIFYVNGKTRISGAYNREGWVSGGFYDRQVGVSQGDTTIPIPDYSAGDEFRDFVQFGMNAMGSYPAEQVVHIEADDGDTVWISPDDELIDKKVIFVESPTPGLVDVNILFGTTSPWQADQDLTVISTGTINYYQPLQFSEDSRLSVVAWDDYTEGSVLYSQHAGVTYAHDDVFLTDLLEIGSYTGNLIANGANPNPNLYDWPWPLNDTAINNDNGISLVELLTLQSYYYSSDVRDGDIPPGFELLFTVGNPHIFNWQEG